MTEQRKQEIIETLTNILDSFEQKPEESEPTMFWLISQYNQSGENEELIGGTWVRENCPSPLKDLP